MRIIITLIQKFINYNYSRVRTEQMEKGNLLQFVFKLILTTFSNQILRNIYYKTKSFVSNLYTRPFSS